MIAPAPTVANPELVEALALADSELIRDALTRATFLVPASTAGADRAIITLALGARRERIAWAFTDPEALRAWDRHPAAEAMVVDADELRSCLGDTGPVVVVLNAAGPAGHLVAADELVPGPRAAVSGEPRDPAAISGLGEITRRVPLRQQVSHAHTAARECMAAGDHAGALIHLRRAREACTALGDRLHGAAVLKEVAHCSAQLGQADSWRAAETAGWLFSSLGELDIGLESFAAAAEQARDDDLPDEAARLVVAALVAAAGPELGERLAGVAAWLGTVTVPYA